MPESEPQDAPPFSRKFHLSITEAMREQLGKALDALHPIPLTEDNVTLVAQAPGVYQLYEYGHFVYVGKAESLRARLSQHLDTIRGRLNLGEVSFTCLELDEDLPTIAPERLLIDWHRKRNEVPWNMSGIGSHDPGGNRDGTNWGPDHFYTQHPIDLEIKIPNLPTVTTPLDQVLIKVKKELPYTFRYKWKNAEDARALYRSIQITLPQSEMKATEVFHAIAAALPEGWQITATVAYVTMYDKVEDVPTALAVYRSPNQTIVDH